MSTALQSAQLRQETVDMLMNTIPGCCRIGARALESLSLNTLDKMPVVDSDYVRTLQYCKMVLSIPQPSDSNPL